MSSNMALRRSPKPGAFSARQFRVPRNRLTTRTAKASLSMSSAMITKFLVTCSTCSSSGTNSWAAEIFLSVIRMNGLSMTASMRCGLVTKYGLIYPRSKFIPSTNSVSDSTPLLSSTVTTPCAPTLSSTSASMLPISVLLAETEATWAIWSRPAMVLEFLPSSATTAATLLSIPRLMAMGSAPATTFLIPSCTIT